jgi:OOP family OmpA-OmpF porin
MRKIAGLAMLLAGILLAPQVSAQGAYAGIGVLSASTSNAEDFAAVFIGPGGSADGSATGLKVFGGYQWPNRFGVEAGYYDLGSYDVRTSGVKSDEFAATAFAISGTYALPMGPGFDLNFKLGLAFTNVDYSCLSGCSFPFVNTGRSGTAGLLGIGVDWRFAPNVSLRADFESFGGVEHSVGGNIGTYDYRTLSLSSQFRF